MAMQKQQQESLRLREAERHRYGEARMQVCCQATLLSFALAKPSFHSVSIIPAILAATCPLPLIGSASLKSP